ncbi:MAG TPA: endonuclease VIII Nei2 [Mycobacterium sp.]|nr:MAG: Fpg/Nei family DNA glycosylase [Mycobacterium sp.]HOB48239.1 endonuclease VIII Nei2 [Mycobacterium sp.]HPZ95836.1 endonuclease VIII Nei2 [Mycobacterium sp.]HQE13580.1 endonuclease VIII Nei2 [Mycobacterium sp.]
MPEGDTVFRTAAALREALVGRTLTRCDVRVPRYATVDLTGSTVDEVVSRGKHLFIRAGRASIHSHLKMDGAWRITPRTRPPRPAYKVRILLEAGDIAAAGVDLGFLEILERDRDQESVAHLGPDLLGPDWDADRAAANLTADPDRPIADALLDQRVLAGIGNVYCNELCFIFGRLPTSPVATLDDPARVVGRARDMLWANRIRWERTTTGNTRKGQELWVYGRAGLPCRRCGTRISQSWPDWTSRSRPDGTSRSRPDGWNSAERVRYWCPACQR